MARKTNAVLQDVQEEILNDSIQENIQEEISSDATSEDTQEESLNDVIQEENKHLIAITPILYHSRQYKPGDSLPAYDAGMVKAWLDAGTAEWQTLKTATTKAKSVVAQPSLPGIAIPSTGGDLAGKITGRRK